MGGERRGAEGKHFGALVGGVAVEIDEEVRQCIGKLAVALVLCSGGISTMQPHQ